MFATEWPILRASIEENALENNPFVRDYSATKSLQTSKKRVAEYKEKTGGHAAWRRRATSSAWRLRGGKGRTHAKPAAVAAWGHGRRAYQEINEIMNSCVIDFPKKSLHLCDRGFLQWFQWNSVQEGWIWEAVVGGPSTIQKNDDEKIFYGDVVHETLKFKELFSSREFDLVTADGIENPSYSEEAQINILYAQAQIALCCLEKNGTLIIRFHEGGLNETLFLLAFLTTQFSNCSIVKPVTTSTTSCRYFIARKFMGEKNLDFSIVQRIKVSHAWMQSVSGVLDEMCDNQKREIDYALSLNSER